MPANLACFVVFYLVAIATYFVMRKLTRGRFVAAFLSALCVLCGFAFAQSPTNEPPTEEVDAAEIKRLGDHVQYVDGDSKSSPGDYVEVMGPPADDNHKWFISIIGSKSCAACARLKADLKSNEYLRALITVHENDDNHSDTKTSWAHYTYYLAGDKSQDFRWKDLKIKGYPTILVQPPLNKKYGDPSTVVVQMTGYDGDGKKLATSIAAGIKAYLAKQAERRQAGHRAQLLSIINERVGEFPPEPPPPKGSRIEDEGSRGISLPPQSSILNPQGSWGQVPWTPAPKVDTPAPTPDVAPSPNVLPPLFDWPPKPIGPAPAPAPAPDGGNAAIPTTPEAVIVCETNLLSAADEDRIRPVIERLRKERPGLRVRIADLRDAKNLPVLQSELPAVIVTSDGKVDEKVTSRLFPLFQPKDPPATPNEPVNVTVPSMPWDQTATAIATGSIPAYLMAGVAWLVWWRQRRKALQQPLLLPNVPVEQLGGLVTQFMPVITQVATVFASTVGAAIAEAMKPKPTDAAK
jgi:hypothetical protein